MAFIILGSVGSALASGLAAVGLGTVGAAGAAGTGIAGAVGSAAGAASGIGAGISGGIASGLGALGVSSGAASAIGTGVTAAAGGAGMGAATSAAMGGDPGQGALMGAIGGGIASGVGGALSGATSGAGGSAGAAGSAVGDGLTTASEAMLNPTAAAAAPGATTVGDIASQTAMNQVGALTPELATQAAAPSSSLFGGLGGDLSEMAVKEGLGMMKPEQGQAVAPRSGGGNRPKSRYDEEQQQGFGNPFANPFGGFAEGGLTTLKGGGISMREGQYVIPADVVSAIGNGSSKAGARFLEQAFEYYMENGPPQGVKPQQRAGSLAEKRMMERLQRESA